MTAAAAAAALWVVGAALAAAIPSRRNHWPAAWALIAAGLPILGWVYAREPWPVSLIVSLAFASVLRWPIRHALRWLRSRAEP
jgi:hypothetical protein